MDALPRNHVVAVVVLLALAGLVGFRLSASRERPEEPAPASVRVETGGGSAGGERMVVHVAGAVRQPGVYRLRAGSRVDDAVRRAGGPTRRAELSGLNLAAELEDGRQVLVPIRAGGAGSAAGPAAAAGSGAVADPAAGAASAPINLNTATIEQLDTLEGIGPATAQAILDWRTENGGFGSVEELGQIPGIGEKRMATLRARVTL